MPDATAPSAPAEDTALSFDQGVEDITNLLSDPVTDLQNEDQGQEAAEGAEEGNETSEEVEAAPDDETEEQEEQDGSEAYSKGKFASADAKVTLKDGSVVAVSDLTRDYLGRAAVTRREQAFAEREREFSAQQEFVGKHAQAIAQQRDFLLSVAPKFLPQAPDRSMMDSDPIGYMQAKADYDDKMAILEDLKRAQQGEMQRAEHDRQQNSDSHKRAEAEKMIAAIPEFKNPKVYQQFWSEAVPMMAEHYGISEQETGEFTDHRVYLMMRDLLKLHKARKSAPVVKEQIQAKPKLISGGKRMDPKAKTSREAQARSQRLRQSGTLADGIAALMDLDL